MTNYCGAPLVSVTKRVGFSKPETYFLPIDIVNEIIFEILRRSFIAQKETKDFYRCEPTVLAFCPFPPFLPFAQMLFARVFGPNTHSS